MLAIALAVHGASMVDEGEGGCGVDVLAVLRWFVQERERDADEEDEDGREEGGSSQVFGFLKTESEERENEI